MEEKLKDNVHYSYIRLFNKTELLFSSQLWAPVSELIHALFPNLISVLFLKCVSFIFLGYKNQWVIINSIARRSLQELKYSAYTQLIHRHCHCSQGRAQTVIRDGLRLLSRTGLDCSRRRAQAVIRLGLILFAETLFSETGSDCSQRRAHTVLRDELILFSLTAQAVQNIYITKLNN